MDQAKIRELNDAFRKGHRPELGRIMITSGARELVNAWPLGEIMLINQVHRFETFTEDNDPWNEHDYGCFEVLGEKVFWKLDFYNTTLDGGSEVASRDATTGPQSIHGFDTQLRLLFATDLSERSDRAFERALLLARHNRAHLIVLNVIDEALPEPIRMRLSQDAQDFIQEQFTAAKIRDQADIEMRIVRGRDFQAIIDQSRDGNVHLVILGVHRTDALIDTFIGATMDRVLSYGHRPVLVVKTKARRAYANVLVATDFSSASRHALEFTIRLLPQAKITLFHAHQSVIAKTMRQNREFEKLLNRRRAALAAMAADVSKDRAQELGTAEFTVTPVFEEGMPLMAIGRQIERDRLDLVVVGTHGRSRLREAMIGSTAKTVLSRIRCDVLAVPPANHD